MTGKSAFTEQEWQAVLEGPPTAGVIVASAERGGSFRESFALARAYAEARQQHGESELLDELASAKPEFDRHRYGSPEALATQGLERLREAVAAVQSRATPEEAADYRAFVVSLAKRVAAAHKEGDESVSAAEQGALDRIEQAMAAPSTAS